MYNLYTEEQQRLLKRIDRLIFLKADKGFELSCLCKQIEELKLKRDRLKEEIDSLDEEIDCEFMILHDTY